MQKYKGTISYDGTNFYGFQIQKNRRTIQGELEKAVSLMHKGTPKRIYGSGRTDTGVHAKAQVFHFDSSLNIPTHQWKKALNSILPNDIHLRTIEPVDETFHARFGAVEKEYRYYVYTDQEPDVFQRNYMYHFPHALNMASIRRGCELLEGEHDFTTFSSAKSTAKGSRIRRLTTVACEQKGNIYEFKFIGNGFLYHMVRIIVGVLLNIGKGRLDPEQIPDLLAGKDRQLAGDTIPPEGLYLWRVTY